MKLPRDMSGRELAQALRKLGYAVTRTSGSHMRLTTQLDGEHHETVPAHDPLKMGTLAAILKSIATHHGVTVADLRDRIGI
jgi:predicted RNA binding protein YcfA (HicA-like mRNA interferase family)